MSIEKAYNSWAEQYDTNKNKTRDLDIKSTIATLDKYDFKKVLELGCGTGKNTVFFLLLLYSSILIAQPGFIKAYNFGYPTAVRFNAMVLDDSEIVLCGYLRDSVPPYQQGVIFAKLDTLGNVLNYTTHFDTSGNNFASGNSLSANVLARLQDSTGYVFTGSTLGGPEGFVMKFDIEGNLVWSKILEDTESLQGLYTKLIETETGLLIGGAKQNSVDGENDIFLIKTDKEGNLLWERFYGALSQSDILSTLLRVNNNEYILGGTERSSAATNGTQIKIYSIDSLGIEKWSWSTNTPIITGESENAGCFGLHQNENGNWVYATVRFEDQQFSNWYAQAQFVVRDSNFNLITERVYDDLDGQTNNFYNLIPLSDGDWLGVGSNGELVAPPTSVIGHNYSWMMRISNSEDGLTSLGDSLWTRLDLAFPDSQYASVQYLHSAVELQSGNIIASGYFGSFSQGQIDHGLLIKVNQHGCIDTVNCNPTNFPNITIANKEISSPDLNIYPNPARHILYIDSEAIPIWDKLELIDMTGQIVKVEKNKEEMKMDGLPPGLYVLRLWYNGQFWTRRVVRQY